MSEQAAQTPLIELARSVPKDLRAEWETQWFEDGTPCGHAMGQVGKHLHDMADEIDRLTAEVKEYRGAAELLLDSCDGSIVACAAKAKLRKLVSGSLKQMGITDPDELCEECDRPMNGADGLFCADCQNDS